MLRQLERGRQYDTVSLCEQLCRISGQSYQSFDPFGLRRNASNWKDLLTSQLNNFDRSVTTRGYTGHEQLDEVGLIHMNGRVYDPKLGRFIQADTFIQFADNTQSYNRYSYVLNNPLRYTDPSGHVIPMIVGIVMTSAGVSAGYTALAVGVATIAQTLFQGGSFEDALKNGLIAGVSSYAFSSIGEHFGELSKANTLGDPGVYEFGGIALTGRQIAAQISLHAITGGVVAELQGGKFAHGFISAGFTKGALGRVGGNFGTRLVAHAVVGGTVSKLTGGKFANGARTGAFQFLFNEVVQKGVAQKEKGFTNGFKQYFADQKKFLTHLDDLSGANGPEAQALSVDANKILMAGVQAIANDLQVEYNGEIVSARGVAWDNFTGMVKDNPSYFAGRFAANTGTSAVLSLPFYKGGYLGVAATLVFGISLQTTASLGAGIRAIENGITNPIDVISHGAYGSP